MVTPMKNIFLLFFIISAISLAVSTSLLLADEEVEHGGDIIYTKPVKAVIFSHKAHTEDIGLQCEWCHDSTFEMEALHMQENANFDMESLCNEAYCGTCHNGDISFSTTVQCARCHIGVKGYNEMVREGKIQPDVETEIPTQEPKEH
jgi:c(7)-type cytochrome triheme protein